MNKIYLEPVEKAQNFIEGVKKQQNLLVKSGIIVDVEELSRLCEALKEAGRRQEEAEEQLRIVREKAHSELNALKDLYSASKAPIKQNFPQETWLSFGLVDKK